MAAFQVFRGFVLGAVVLAAPACGGAGSSDSEGGGGNGGAPPPPNGCDGDTVALPDGSCLPVGIGDDLECPPGEYLHGGTCIFAGVPPDGCGPGATHDGLGGCDPILPAAPCPSGTMAVPGETECREVADCGDAPWGNIPVDTTTVYVDGSFNGTSDGSSSAPFKTIQQGVDAAADGAVVAVAEGTYAGNVVVNHPVKLWGRCPSLVSVESTGPGQPISIFVIDDGAGSELHGLGITSTGFGIVVQNVEEVVATQLWIHDVADIGFFVDHYGEPASGTIEASLVERTGRVGIGTLDGTLTVRETVVRDIGFIGIDGVGELEGVSLAVERSLLAASTGGGVRISGATLVLADSVIRDVVPTDLGVGHGVIAQLAGTGHPNAVSISRTVLLRTSDVAVALSACVATMDAVTVRDVAGKLGESPQGLGVGARGIPAMSESGSLTIERSFVTGHGGPGIAVASQPAVVDAVQVRDGTQGIFASDGATAADSGTEPTTLQLMRSAIIDHATDGVYISGSKGLVDGTVVQGNTPGILVAESLAQASMATVTRSRLTGNGQAGVMTLSSETLVDQCHLAASVPDEAGRCYGVYSGPKWHEAPPSTVTVTNTLVEANPGIGIGAVGSDLSVARTLVRNTSPVAATGLFGDAFIAIAFNDFRPSLSLDAVTARDSARAAVANLGGYVVIGNSSFDCAKLFLTSSPTDAGEPAEFADLGGNRCGCEGEEVVCKVVNSELEAPPALEGEEDPGAR